MKPILQQVAMKRKQSVIAFQYRKPTFEAPWHFHPEHELIYIENSVGTKFIGDFVGSYEAGELMLLRSNLPHSWKNYDQVNNEAHSTVIQWYTGIFAKVPELEAVFRMLNIASRGILFDQTGIQPLLPNLLQMPYLAGDELYFQLLLLLRKLTDCDYQTLSEASFMQDISTEHSSRMAKIHDFVEAHYARKIYLKELADLLNLSEYAFSRFFSKMMGRPFFNFLNEYRINIASRMLIETDLSVAEIGYASGYESLTFFYKQFAKFKKISPLKYRKQYCI